MDDLVSPYGTNSGHGHVWARPDGQRARCGGPRLCGACATDDAKYGWDALAARITALEAENARLTTDKAGLVGVVQKLLDYFGRVQPLVFGYDLREQVGAVLNAARAALEQHGGKTDG